MDGILLINKEKEYTSQDVVSKVKKILNEKKVGHAGTLDPLATGVLPVLVGYGTKISKYLIEHDKEYIATIKFGIKTDTGDLEGKTIQEEIVKDEILEEDKIKFALKSFLGESFQIPPMYSAIKVDGKKLYEYAREGIQIERQERKIFISNIYLISVNNEEKEIEIRVNCSKGTYIRTLCEDIAEELGTIGVMKNLIRTKVDKFDISDSITLNELEVNKDKVISIEKYFSEINSIDKIDLDEKQKKLFENGTLINTNSDNGIFRIYSNSFLGIGIVKEGKLKRDIVIAK